MIKGNLVLISGSSGVGKNTVISALMEENKGLTLLRSCTSRPIRVDDKIQSDGRYAYDFLTKDEFEDKIAKDEMLEYDIFSGNYYGVAKNSVEEAVGKGKTAIKDITVKGVISCKDKLPKSINIVSVFLTLNQSKLRKRLVLRQTKDIRNRMKHYKYEQKSIPLYDFCVLNDDLSVTLDKMRAILTSSQEILAGESINNFAQAKVDKIVSKIKLNKKVNKVEVALKNGKIYIVRGYLTYLASQKAGVAVTKYFVDNRKIVEVDQSHWLSLVESQKNK